VYLLLLATNCAANKDIGSLNAKTIVVSEGLLIKTVGLSEDIRWQYAAVAIAVYIKIGNNVILYVCAILIIYIVTNRCVLF